MRQGDRKRANRKRDAELVKLARSGLSAAQVSDRTGVKVQTVHYVLGRDWPDRPKRAAGGWMPTDESLSQRQARRGRASGRARRGRTTERDAEIRRLMAEEPMTNREIAGRVGVSEGMVRKVLKREVCDAR